MLEEELIELAEEITRLKTENQSVEVQAAHDGFPKRLYAALSGFSNRDGGGVLLFGLDAQQEYEPVGVYNLQDLKKKMTEQCNQMQPPVRAVFTQAVYRGVNICSLEIPSIDLAERPCYYAGAGRSSGAYLRVGTADLPMTDYELYCYDAFRKHLHDDDRPIERAEYALLDAEKVEGYIQKMKAERPGLAQISGDQLNELLSITRRGVPTLAAVMNFGRYPQGYLPQLVITAEAYDGPAPGTDMSAGEAELPRESRRIEGTLPEMLAEAVAFAERNLQLRNVTDPKTGSRHTEYAYPLTAVREAVRNALIHRDYSVYTEGTPIRLSIYADRLELRSPGGLYGRLTTAELGTGRPDLRNPVLAAMSEFLLQGENGSAGISGLRRAMEHAGLPAPVFEDRRGEFVVTFCSREAAAGPQQAGTAAEAEALAETDEERVLLFCRVPRSRREIAEYMGLGTVFYAVQKFVQPLLLEGKLEMTLPDKPKSSKQRYFSARVG